MCFFSFPEWRQDQQMDVVELYAGKARISKLASWCGWSSRALDVDYHPPRLAGSGKNQGRSQRSCMDMCGEAGYLFFGVILYLCFFMGHVSYQLPVKSKMQLYPHYFPTFPETSFDK